MKTYPLPRLVRHSITLFAIVFLSVTIFAQTAPVVQPEKAGISAERLERMEDFLKRHIQEKKIPGAVSLIYRKGQVAHFTSFGHQLSGGDKPMPKDAIFYIQSMTKPIATVGIMMLYEEGHFELKDPVEKYLPQFANRKVLVPKEGGRKGFAPYDTVDARRSITISDLLSHTAGLLHGIGGTELDREYARALYYQPHKTIEDRVNALATMPLIEHPGETWYYSAAPDVLCLLIEKFSGMAVDKFLQKRLFDPLGMDDTGYNVDPAKADRVAALHRKNDAGQIEPHPQQTATTGNTVFGGTHAMFSTAEDYLRFTRMLLNGGTYNGKRFLSRKTIELMRAGHVDERPGAPGEGFGLGFGVRTDLADAKTLGSEGQYYWSGANNTFFFIDPEEELIAILMMQFAPYTGFYGRMHKQMVYQAIGD